MKAIIFTEYGVRVLADSALARNKQPWFLPDFGRDWHWDVAKAVRIGRLGKGIRPEFVERYVDAQSLLWLPTAQDNPAEDYMDGAAVVGDWLPLSTLEHSYTETLVVRASQFATLKTGDIIAATDISYFPQPIEINQHISLQLQGTTVLDFNIK